LGRAPPRLAAAVSAGAAVAVFAALYAADLDSAGGVPVLGIAAWVISATVQTVQRWGSLGVLALMALESSSLPVPSEVVLPLSGYLIRAGSMDPVTAFLAALAGSMAGSYVDYYIGRAFGVEVLGRLPWVSGDALRRAEEWFRRYGEPMVIVTRMIPGMRTLISFPAGALGMGAAKFGVYTAIGSALWDAVLMGAGYGLAAGWEAASAAAQDLLIPTIAAAAVGMALYVALTAAWPAMKEGAGRGGGAPPTAGRPDGGPASVSHLGQRLPREEDLAELPVHGRIVPPDPLQEEGRVLLLVVPVVGHHVPQLPVLDLLRPRVVPHDGLQLLYERLPGPVEVLDRRRSVHWDTMRAPPR
jgi:membrane protein DedA with SNARE-associated domain